MKRLDGIYRAVCESRDDNLQLGRIKVRVFGIHTHIKNKVENAIGIPVDELPWATPANPISEGSISGFGSFSVPLQGSHVFVFFENGNPKNPVYFASVPGITKDKPNKDLGFSDPDGIYPTDQRLGESDVHRLARGVTSGTVIDGRNNNVDANVQCANGVSWSEPKSAYQAKYPDNIVMSTHGGNIIELDSTSGHERIHIFHSSNSYIEIDVDGNMIVRNNKDKYEVVIGGKNLHIKGVSNTTVDRDKNELVKGNLTLNIDKDYDVTVTGNNNIVVGGNCNLNVTGHCAVVANNITLDGTGSGGNLTGVVTQECLCAFTNKPHIQFSSNVKATL